MLCSPPRPSTCQRICVVEGEAKGTRERDLICRRSLATDAQWPPALAVRSAGMVHRISSALRVLKHLSAFAGTSLTSARCAKCSSSDTLAVPPRRRNYERTRILMKADASGWSMYRARSPRSRRRRHGPRASSPETIAKPANETPKGDPLEIARIAGIMAAKRTSELIPLCHQVPLSR